MAVTTYKRVGEKEREIERQRAIEMKWTGMTAHLKKQMFGKQVICSAATLGGSDRRIVSAGLFQPCYRKDQDTRKAWPHYIYISVSTYAHE